MKRALQVGLMWGVFVGFMTLGTVEIITGWPETKSDRRDEIAAFAAAAAFLVAATFVYFNNKKNR